MLAKFLDRSHFFSESSEIEYLLQKFSAPQLFSLFIPCVVGFDGFPGSSDVCRDDNTDLLRSHANTRQSILSSLNRATRPAVTTNSKVATHIAIQTHISTNTPHHSPLHRRHSYSTSALSVVSISAQTIYLAAFELSLTVGYGQGDGCAECFHSATTYGSRYKLSCDELCS
jgi:hypothetical protein